MNLIRMSKGLQISRRNQILMESIGFQERLFERMQQSDYPLMEKLRMTQIIKGNIEEFCHLKLSKANATTLWHIQDSIESLYANMESYLSEFIEKCTNGSSYVRSVMDEIDKMDVSPVQVTFQKKVKENKNEPEKTKSTVVIFTYDENKLGGPVSNDFGTVVIKTPKIILAISYFIAKVSRCASRTLIDEISFPAFEAREDVSVEELDQMFTFSNDVIFRTPYDSYSIILKFMESKLRSPKYHTILMTLYRTAENSVIVDMLCKYAELYRVVGSKRIFVYVETMASGNEDLNRKNIDKLSKAGVYVIYGSEYKVHTKMFIALGSHNMWAHFSTGNYNEKSAKIYTDIQLITKDKSKILPAVNTFYKFIWGKTLVSEELKSTNCIWFSPNDLKSILIGLFREQIKLGEKGKITLKVNSIADEEILEYIHEAAENGVRVHIICRSICLIDPTELIRPNIIIESYCGRFLEHDRIYGFGDRYFIASADLSFRNMHKRVESFIEMTDPACSKYLKDVVENMGIENPYKFVMTRDGEWKLEPSEE